MMDSGIEVNLPEVENAPTFEAVKEPLVVTVEKSGTISIGRSKVENVDKLTPVLLQILKERKQKEVFLEADRDVSYGKVVRVMAAIKKAGVQKLGMVSQEPEL
jgi:biopolymer transport protein TolR